MKKIIVLAALFSVLLMLSVAVVAAPKLGRITFIHYKNAPVRPSGCNNDGKCQGWEDASCGDCSSGGESSCYGFISKGLKWKWQEPYSINPTNSDGLSPSFVQTAIDYGVAEWESYAGDVFAGGFLTYNATFDEDADGNNEIVFGNWPDSNVIAVTRIWGVWWGKPAERYIAEFDILFNDPNYVWGDAGINPSVMDLQNIATHELGHGFGMDDLYETRCIDETMYGYSSEGETAKRDLNSGDIAGIRALYA